MTFPRVSFSEWRAQAEKELAGAPFERLVYTSPEGIAIQPLYVEATADMRAEGAVPAAPSSSSFRLCMRNDGGAAAIADDAAGGADALWLDGEVPNEIFAHADAERLLFVLNADRGGLTALNAAGIDKKLRRFALTADPVSAVACGYADPLQLQAAVVALGPLAKSVRASFPLGIGVTVSTLAAHSAGADAADEIAYALSTGAAYLAALCEAGLTADAAAKQIAVQMAVGRDTFGELCKLRALRVCWQKLFAAAAAPASSVALLHAVCSSRTLTARDPSVNILRTTTQMFAAILAGADLVTPNGYDQAIGGASALAHRLARNTGLVLYEESHLGRVVDPAGGSYYVESLTEALAREAWSRFRALEGEGGILVALTSGSLGKRYATAWQKWNSLVGRRKEAIIGVSEFVNLDEQPVSETSHVAPARARTRTFAPLLSAHRDAEAFEALRDRVDALRGGPCTVALVTLGPANEYRARAGFATGFFAAAGLRSETRSFAADVSSSAVVCLCGSDERYATEAVEAARALKAAGARRVMLAGRPGALEAALRDADIDDFIYLGCDALPVLTAAVGALA